MLDPKDGNYSIVPLGILAKLSTGPSVALAEICFQYQTNYAGGKVGTTGKLSLQAWYPKILGHHVDDGFEYKYFKRDVLKKIILEINQECPFEVSLNEIKVGRTVRALEFLIQSKAKPKVERLEHAQEGDILELDVGENDYLIRRIVKEIGTNQKDAALILSKYKDPAYIENHIQQHLKQRAGGFVPDSEIALFKARFKQNYADTPAPQSTLNTHISQRMVPSEPEVIEADNDTSIDILEQLSEQEQDQILGLFLEDQTGFVQERFRKNRLQNRLVRAHLRVWLKNNGITSIPRAL